MRALVGATLVIIGAGTVGWVLAARRRAEIEAELDRPDLERFAVERRLAELEGSVPRRSGFPKAA